jgi:predicted transposase/invertase (TIGR01784 family)
MKVAEYDLKGIIQIMNEELVVKPKLDVVFKTLFEHNTDLLIDFLVYALNMSRDEISNITITNPDLTPDEYGEKFAKLDLVLTQPNGTKINVEIQNRDEGNYPERSVFNCSKMYTKDLKSGYDYAEIAKTICINIVQFDLFKNSDCVCTVFPTIQETGEIVTDKWEIIYFQTSKLPQEKNGGLWEWLKFFTITTVKELDVMERTMTSGVKKAAVVIRQMNADEKMKEIARIREKAALAEWSAMTKSRQEGIISEKYNIARTMISDGMSFDAVSKYTGIPSETLRTLTN